MVIPGNHDARNVGYVHFEELIGPRWQTLHDGRRHDRRRSTPREPDLDYGQIGQGALRLAARAVRRARRASASSCCTTTCCRSPARGASATSSTTPATCSRCCRSAASTSCSRATSTCPTPGGSSTCSSSTPAPAARCACAGNTKACYNIIRIDGDRVQVARKYPFHGDGDAHRLRAVHGVVRQVHLPGARGGEQIGARLPRAVVLVDGEHYPPVVAAALARLRRRYDGGGRASSPAAARSCAAAAEPRGREAATARPGRASPPRSACRGWTPWSRGRRPSHEVLDGVRAALRAARAEALVDLSDEPVVGYRERFLLMSAALAEGARLRGRGHRGAAAGVRAPRAPCRRSP